MLEIKKEHPVFKAEKRKCTNNFMAGLHGGRTGSDEFKDGIPPWLQAERISCWERIQLKFFRFITIIPVVITFGIFIFLAGFFSLVSFFLLINYFSSFCILVLLEIIIQCSVLLECGMIKLHLKRVN